MLMCVLLELLFCHEGPMGKFGSPHKLCIIRTLEFVYFSFLGSLC